MYYWEPGFGNYNMNTLMFVNIISNRRPESTKISDFNVLLTQTKGIIMTYVRIIYTLTMIIDRRHKGGIGNKTSINIISRTIRVIPMNCTTVTMLYFAGMLAYTA